MAKIVMIGVSCLVAAVFTVYALYALLLYWMAGCLSPNVRCL